MSCGLINSYMSKSYVRTVTLVGLATTLNAAEPQRFAQVHVQCLIVFICYCSNVVKHLNASIVYSARLCQQLFGISGKNRLQT